MPYFERRRIFTAPEQIEADIPEQLPPAAARRLAAQYRATNQNRLVAPEDVLRVFDFSSDQRHHDAFSPAEELMFALAFKDNPKEFGKIAELLPGRNSLDCKTHYYLHKYDKRFKSKSMRQSFVIKSEDLLPFDKQVLLTTCFNIDLLPESDLRILALRDGRAILYDETEDTLEAAPDSKQDTESPCNPPDIRDLVPLDMEINRLRSVVSQNNQPAVLKKYPRKDIESIVLPQPNLDLLLQIFRYPYTVTPEKILAWLRSPAVLLLVKEWTDALFTGSARLFGQLQTLLPGDTRSTANFLQDISSLAQRFRTKNIGEMHIPQEDAVKLCVETTAKIAHANHLNFFSQWHGITFPERLMYRASAAVLITLIADLQGEHDGFWELLLESELAELMKPAVRYLWERKYPFVGEMVDGVVVLAKENEAAHDEEGNFAAEDESSDRAEENALNAARGADDNLDQEEDDTYERNTIDEDHTGGYADYHDSGEEGLPPHNPKADGKLDDIMETRIDSLSPESMQCVQY